MVLQTLYAASAVVNVVPAVARLVPTLVDLTMWSAGRVCYGVYWLTWERYAEQQRVKEAEEAKQREKDEQDARIRKIIQEEIIQMEFLAQSMTRSDLARFDAKT